MRLNRGGNRQLNRALYQIAIVQLRHHSPARAFVVRKRAEGKSSREAAGIGAALATIPIVGRPEAGLKPQLA